MTKTPEFPKSEILIVEDEVVVSLDLATSLRTLGYGVAGEARTAEQAISQVQQVRPDLVLMDIKLKGSGDGVAAAATIRERWNIPVVFVTANTNPETIARAKASGPYGFIAKPFRPRELDVTIGIALRQHKLTRELFAEQSWFTRMMASLSDGVIATDADGFVRYMNPAAEAMICWTAKDALGLPIEQVYPLSTMERQPVEDCQLRKALASREPIGKQRFLVHVKGDDQLPVEDSASPIIEGGQILGAVTIFLDISERLQQEEQEFALRDQLREQVNLTNEALGNTRQELQALSHHLMSVQEEDRARIARELHDDLGQRTALLGMRVQHLDTASPGDLKPQIAVIQDDLQSLADGLREVSHRLHPSVIADLGLTAALASLVEDFRQQDLKVSLKIEGTPRAPEEIATALYRIVQEALSNVKKHARDAPVEVKLCEEVRRVRLSICDEGLGFSLAEARKKGGLGLLSMQERARLVGGTLLLSAAPGKGTTVLVNVPVQD